MTVRKWLVSRLSPAGTLHLTPGPTTSGRPAKPVAAGVCARPVIGPAIPGRPAHQTGQRLRRTERVGAGQGAVRGDGRVVCEDEHGRTPSPRGCRGMRAANHRMS